MDAAALQYKIARGMGVAARKVGGIYTVYRPKTANSPIDERNRVIKLFAAFEPDGDAGGGGRFQPLWRGLFDAFYTKPGDYIAGGENTYFVGAQTAAQPIRCVLTNRSVTILRPTFSAQGGYNGLYASGGQAVITGWPAALFESGGSSKTVKAGADSVGSWTVLLPRLKATPQLADVVTDDIGSTYTVDAAEQNSQGWRLLARQISA